MPRLNAHDTYRFLGAVGDIPLRVADGQIILLGTDGDLAVSHRATSLNANTALTNVLVGTPAAAASPANSMFISNVTADGDIALFTRNAAGANSIEMLRLDASAGLNVFNEAAGDVDFRVEGDNNANMLVIDAGTDSIGFGAAVTAGAFFSHDGSAVNRDGVTSVGRGLHMPAATFTQTNTASTTLAIGARVVVATPTFAGSNASQVITDAAALYITAAAAAGTNMTLTRTYSLLCDGGQLRVDSNVQINNTATFASTQPTASAVFQAGTAPAGAITTGGAVFTDGTVMKKIIADGTVSNIET